jgi:hypothetical protein
VRERFSLLFFFFEKLLLIPQEKKNLSMIGNNKMLPLIVKKTKLDEVKKNLKKKFESFNSFVSAMMEGGGSLEDEQLLLNFLNNNFD